MSHEVSRYELTKLNVGDVFNLNGTMYMVAEEYNPYMRCYGVLRLTYGDDEPLNDNVKTITLHEMMTGEVCLY